MAGVILAILKWTGIVLGGALLLVLLLLALILFVPVRYEIDAKIPKTLFEEGWTERLKKESYAKASFHWLFHLVRGWWIYPDAPELVVRPKLLMKLFGGSAEDDGGTGKSPYEVFCKIQYTISSVCDKIEKVRALLESDSFERAKDCVMKQVPVLLKGILPKKSQVRLLYGTGDPCLTAEILAVHGMLYPHLARVFDLRADFEQKIIDGDLRLRGRIRLFTVLKCLLILYFNKDIRLVRARVDKIRRRQDEPEPVS